MTQPSYNSLLSLIHQWAADAGFSQVGISDVDMSKYEDHYKKWIEQQYHGQMHYMQEHQTLRLNPQHLQPKALRAISFRMDYHDNDSPELPINGSDTAYIARYARGRDYHKMIRKKLAGIAQKIEEFAELNLSQRAFVDSAPVLERALAEKAGMGWIGKNTMLINPKAGSWFFLAEILTDLPLPTSNADMGFHCGSCQACLDICPTDAFVSANVLDARKCISYLTIELKEAIPKEFRKAIGNRVFGCDDCQIICPWNKFAQPAAVDDFKPRHQLDNSQLLTLFSWDETTFLNNTAGSPIRRIGYQRWLRNLAIGLGNAEADPTIIKALKAKIADTSVEPMVKEHMQWALAQQQSHLH